MSKVYVGKPRLVEPWSPRAREPNTVCQKTLYDDRRPYLCCAPTLDGKQYCDTCFKETLTGGDRKPPEAVAIEQLHWTNDKRKRA